MPRGVYPRPLERQFWSKVKRSDGCWVWTGRHHEAGYGLFRRQRVYAHRFSWELHFGPVPDALWVLHRCDNPPCVRPDHLFLGTLQVNHADMVAKNRHHRFPILRGVRNPLAKLSESAVFAIRRRYAAGGVTQQLLGREYGVSQATISAVILDKTWPQSTPI